VLICPFELHTHKHHLFWQERKVPTSFGRAIIVNSTIKLNLIQNQKRAFVTGTVEYVNNEWLFYDLDSDDVHPVKASEEKLEVFCNQSWCTGLYKGHGKITTDFDDYELQHGDLIRLRRQLPFAFEQMVNELSDGTCLQFVKMLNELGFSIFDCIYNYNQLLFYEKKARRKGVSFYHFDNEDCICALQHHFERGIKSFNRFEFTTSLGKRAIFSDYQYESA
jgi:hypothetical protein